MVGGVGNGVVEEDGSWDLNPRGAAIAHLTLQLGKEKSLDHVAAVQDLGHTV